jgi:hypothetical protein
MEEEACGVGSVERKAVLAAMEGRADALHAMPIWQLEEAAAALAYCKRQGCRLHNDPAAQDLIEQILDRGPWW